MAVADKVVFRMSSILFSSKLMRLVAVIYVLVLHCLTFAVLVHVTHSRHGHMTNREWHCLHSAAGQAIESPTVTAKSQGV
jgi:hypothetical protein